ncbi:DNA-binding GntR family transcriptional regulator [Mycetocola sp. BIGb0189]|uniref:GntR family transcriptional regulator n=1 Tax=Mycetocola sp. BIGb0189 TaxID=2940604 RepID=UPI0021675BD8|nr:GntR family transcriptional regulator [Mycetocola sp. BIGb0189]MCS4275398.1 DNA-binding GntR family transcriptional regulator [Mycetocola sp. BIGb0189]
MTSSSASAPRASARSIAYTEIRERVIRGTYAPGTGLSEADLAGELGVSRQPVREALLLVAQEGLVEVRPQSGTYVARIDSAVVRQAQFIREAIELASLEACRDRVGEAQIARLRDIIARQREVEDPEDFYPLDEEFHRALLGIPGHETAWATVAGAKGHLDRVRYHGLTGFRSVAEYIRDHERIVDALESGSIPGAAAELRSHLRFVLIDLDGLERSHPEYFEPVGPARR